jgi:hypothetical protein
MKSVEEFQRYFNEQMLPDLQVLDQRRKTVVGRSTRVILISLAVLAFIALLYHYYGRHWTNENTIIFFIAAAVLVVIAAIITFGTWAADKTFYSDFKSQVIERIVKFVHPTLVYEPSNFVGADSFQRSRIFLNSIDRYRGDDMVSGMIDKTQIWFSEVKAEYKVTTTDSKGNTRTTWHTIFQGMFFIADFNKHFQTSTVVLPNKMGNNFLSNLFNKMNLGRREKLVKLEDPDFNKQFVVYGEDQVEARYILSTALMRRICEYRSKHKGHLFISFVNSFLHVAISYPKALFEPSYFKSLTSFDQAKEFFEQIYLAVSIVEELNLNTRIWTKD